MKLDSKLINLRKKNRFSQMETAKRLNVSQSAYFKWEKGSSKPNTKNLQKIAVFYNIDISILLDNSRKILFLDEEIDVENNTAPVIYTQISKNFIETLLQNQANITRVLEMYLRLFEKLNK